MKEWISIGDTVRWNHSRYKTFKLFVSRVWDGTPMISIEPTEKALRNKLEPNPEIIKDYQIHPMRWFISARAILTEKVWDYLEREKISEYV